LGPARGNMRMQGCDTECCDSWLVIHDPRGGCEAIRECNKHGPPSAQLQRSQSSVSERTSHDKHISLTEAVHDFVVFAVPLAQLEVPSLPKRNGADCAILSIQRLIVRVPANAVVTVSVKVQQAAVELRLASLLCKCLHTGQQRRCSLPWLACSGDAGAKGPGRRLLAGPLDAASKHTTQLTGKWLEWSVLLRPGCWVQQLWMLHSIKGVHED
jgi:hypothetical protein